MAKLRPSVDVINSSSRLKLPADPAPDMLRISRIAEQCVRHHPTLALSTWKSSIGRIRTLLENVEDIYDKARCEESDTP